MKADPRQFDLFAPASPPEAVALELPADELGAAIVNAGLCPNDYLLRLNGVMTPYEAELAEPWSLPSRMFRFPIETSEPCFDRKGNYHPRRIGMRHALLADHPLVQRVERELGMKLPVGAPNIHGYSNVATALWWHAVDLVSAGQWQDLLRTRQFTTDADIVRAVAYGLDYGPYEGKRTGCAHLTTREARTILEAIGAGQPSAPGPEDALRVVNLHEGQGSDGKTQRSIHWMSGPGDLANVWGRIVGIERGWLKTDRSGFLKWTDAAKRKETLLV